MTALRWITAGESHGPSLTVVIDGVPSGLGLLAEHINLDLSRRQSGFGRGGRMKIELDRATIAAGVRGGETLGSPIALSVENLDFVNWQGRMGASPFASPPTPEHHPRAGHADLAGGLKYNRDDLRDVAERASARETAARVAVGAVARRLLDSLGVQIASRVISIGPVHDRDALSPEELFQSLDHIESSELRVANIGAEAAMRAAIVSATQAGDTLGGVVEVVAKGVPVGLGSYVQWDRRLDGRLARAAMSVPAIKAVEIGDGWASSALRGSEVHDPICHDPLRGLFRPSNRAGGVEGGVTNGEPVVLRAAMKPLSTLKKPIGSVDLCTREPTAAAPERSDVCAVPAVAVVLEAMLALTLADAALEKFGGDSLAELLRNLDGYRAQMSALWSSGTSG